MSRLEALEAALAKQRGDFISKVVTVKYGENRDDAIARAGLADWPGTIVVVTSYADAYNPRPYK